MQHYTWQRRVLILSLFGFTLLLIACGGGPATPTALPPDAARPVQPTPAYGNSTQFSLATPPPGDASAANREPITPTQSVEPPPITPQQRTLPAPQTLSALGIATDGAALLDQPVGRVLLQLPPGEVVTVTGKSGDERYLAAYTNGGVAGWITVGQLTLYGADDLVVVAETAGPGPIATLLAEAMQPVRILDALVATPTAADGE